MTAKAEYNHCVPVCGRRCRALVVRNDSRQLFDLPKAHRCQTMLIFSSGQRQTTKKHEYEVKMSFRTRPAKDKSAYAYSFLLCFLFYHRTPHFSFPLVIMLISIMSYYFRPIVSVFAKFFVLFCFWSFCCGLCCWRDSM